MTQRPTLFLIDGSSFLYRAYHALQPMTTSSGQRVQAVFGFCRMLKKLINQFHPEHMALVWDSGGKTVRHELFTAYKASRQERPSDLLAQKELIEKFATLIGLAQAKIEGVEADDILFSLARDAEKEQFDAVIISSDKDLAQAITPHCQIFDPFKDLMLNAKNIEEKYGFPLDRFVLYYALIGDSSDNIPGVAGIGQKTALELAQQFSSIAELYAQIDQVKKDRTKQLLFANKENAFLSEKLFRLQYHPPPVLPSECTFDESRWADALPLFQELEFKSLAKDILPSTHPADRVAPHEKKTALPYSFICVTTEKQLEAIVAEIKAQGHVAIDTESTGLDPIRNELVGISLCAQKGTAYYIPVRHTTIKPQLPLDSVVQAVSKITSSPDIKKYFHNAKFDMHLLAGIGVLVNTIDFDTCLAASLIVKNGDRIGLKALSESFLGESMLLFKDVVTKKGATFAEISLEQATPYAAADAHQTFCLMPILQGKLLEAHQESLFATLELPLINVLFSMEEEGIHLDLKTLEQINQETTKELEILLLSIARLAGDRYRDINLNSPKQLGALLFDELKLTPRKKTAKKTGYSTDQSVLEELYGAHPIVPLIMRYRELQKLKSTYLDALPSFINPKTGNIHTSFSQVSTATGRLASSDPNLQNIPVGGSEKPSIRSAFQAPKGSLFISADYSQIELRVLAHLSQDEALVAAFLQNRDIHRETAAGLFEISRDAVTQDQRQVAKRINFSILYGLTPYGLSKDLKIPLAAAKIYIERYLNQYPGVTAWMEKVIECAKENGFVETVFGRRRYVPEIHERNKTLFDAARRIAINTVAQGTAAELMKKGMIHLSAALTKNYPSAKLLLQIHDELLMQAPYKIADEIEMVSKHILESVVSWNIPLVVSTRKGATWHEATK